MPFPADIEAFVQAAVRLPHDRLRKIDRQWDDLSAERRVISELVQGSDEARVQVSRRRDYIAVTARMAGAAGQAETGPTSLLIEDVTEAIFPAGFRRAHCAVPGYHAREQMSPVQSTRPRVFRFNIDHRCRRGEASSGEPGGARRPPFRGQSDDYAGETELSKLIRYGCLFELEVHQMEEQRHLQAENSKSARILLPTGLPRI